MNRIPSIAGLALALTAMTSAQMIEQWAEVYNGTANARDVAYAVAVDKRLNTYVVGESARTTTGVDYFVAKYGPNGGPVLWDMSFSGPSDGDDIPCAIAVDEANNAVYVTGTSSNGPAGQVTQRDILTVRLNATTGTEVWRRRFDYSPPGGSSQDDSAADLALSKEGDIFIVGSTQSLFGSPDILVIRYDPSGTIAPGWPVVYDDGIDLLDVGVAIAVGPSDNVFVAGQTSRSVLDKDWITIRFTGAGAFVWKRYTHGTFEPEAKDDAPTDIVVDAANNVFVCGYVFNGADNPDMGTVSFDINGNDRWSVPATDRPLEYSSRTNAGYDIASALDIEIDNMGVAVNVFVTGSGEPVSNQDYITLCYSAAANTSTHTWDRIFAGLGNSNDHATSVAVAGNGNVYVTGHSGGGVDGDDMLTVKYSKSGVLMSFIAYEPNASQAKAIADSCAGKTHVTGYRSTNSDDFWSIVYSQQNRVDIPVSSFTLVRGTNPSGNLASFQTSDDSWYAVQPGVVFSTNDYPVEIIVNGQVSSSLTVNELCLQLEAHSHVNTTMLQRVDFYNYATGSWVQMDERFATTSDSTLHLAAQYDPNEFLGAPDFPGGPRPVRARVMFKAGGVVLFFPWTVRVDFAGWHTVD